MNIYHVSQEEYYDRYSDFVVICDTEEEARNTHPDGYDFIETKTDNKYGIWVSKEELDKVRVVLIGVANKDAVKGVICSSYQG